MSANLMAPLREQQRETQLFQDWLKQRDRAEAAQEDAIIDIAVRYCEGEFGDKEYVRRILEAAGPTRSAPPEKCAEHDVPCELGWFCPKCVDQERANAD